MGSPSKKETSSDTAIPTPILKHWKQKLETPSPHFGWKSQGNFTEEAAQTPVQAFQLRWHLDGKEPEKETREGATEGNPME